MDYGRFSVSQRSSIIGADIRGLQQEVNAEQSSDEEEQEVEFGEIIKEEDDEEEVVYYDEIPATRSKTFTQTMDSRWTQDSNKRSSDDLPSARTVEMIGGATSVIGGNTETIVYSSQLD